MKIIGSYRRGIAISGLMLAGLLLAAAPALAQDKPNILVIFGDDIGMWNISAYSHGMMGPQTPNIDRIAHEGMMFTDHYAHPSCTAGRAAFLTGQYPIRTGLTTVGLPGPSRVIPWVAEGGPNDRRSAQGKRLYNRPVW